MAERGSDKHGPRLDDDLHDDTRSLEQGAPVEARVEEEREQEGPADDQPTPEARLSGGRATAASLDLDDAEARADLARFLHPSTFPADREALLADATGMNAPAVVLERLRALPAGQTFRNVQEVWVALGGMVEHRF
jgi:Protein of unknown function (DUF2795)